MGEHPEHEQDPGDEQDPAPEVRRPERVEQASNTGASRCRPRRPRRPPRASRARWRPRRLGGVGDRLGGRVGATASAPVASASSASASGSHFALALARRRRLRGGRRLVCGHLDARGPRAAMVGISMTWAVPPAASIFSRALRVKASASTNSLARDVAVAEDLERQPVAPDEAGLLEGVGVDRDRGALLDLELAGLDRRADRADVDDLVLDVVDVPEAAELRDPDVERRLAALEPGRDRRAGARALALRAAARGLALAGGDAAADPGPLGDRPLGGVQVVDLHQCFSGVVASAPSGSSSTVTRKRTWRTMPRTAGLSGRIDELPIPCRPERADRRPVAGDVADRAPGLGDAQPTGHRPPPGRDEGRGRLAGDDEAQLDAALARQLLDGAQPAEGVERGAGHVHRVGGAVDLGQDVADARRLDDGAHGAAGDDAGALARPA